MEIVKGKRNRKIILASTVTTACIVLCLTVFGIIRYRSLMLVPPEHVVIRNSIVSWQKNDQATGYMVYIDGQETEVNGTEYALNYLSDAKTYEIKIKTLSDGKKHHDSGWSNPEYITRLESPNLTVCKDKLEWNQIDLNAGYTLYHKDEYLADTDENDTLYELLKETKDEEYSIAVKGDGINSMDSDKSPKTTNKKLEAPKNPNMSETVLSWDHVTDADYYIVTDHAELLMKVYEPSVDLKDVNPASYDITVQAASEKESFDDSEKTPVTITIEKKPLTLTGVSIQNRMLMWNKLSEANGYEITVRENNTMIKTVSISSPLVESFDLTGLLLKDGIYEAEIIAKGNHYYNDSPPHMVGYIENSKEQKAESAGKNNLGAIRNAQINQGVLTWDALQNTGGYNVNIEKNDNIINHFRIDPSQKLELNIPALLLTPGKYKVTLYAFGNQSYNHSPEESFLYTVVKLDAPGNLAFSSTELTWNSVKNADKYIIVLGNRPPVTVTDTRYSVPSILPGNYTVSVQAASDNAELQNSDSSFIHHSQPKLELGSIKNIRIETGVFKWDPLQDAASYAAQIIDSSGKILYTYEKAASNNPEIDLYAVNLPLGSYTVTLKALGDDVYNDSAVVNTAYTEKIIRDVVARANFNYDNKYSDSSQYFIQHFLNFSLKEGFTFDPITASPDEWSTVYIDFLESGGFVKDSAAQKIGSDIIITYYYLNDSGQPVALNKTGGLPLIKNKLGEGLLHRYIGGEYTGLPGTPAGSTSIGNIVPANTGLQVTSNIGRQSLSGDDTPVISTDLDLIKGKFLYADIDLIIRDDSGVKYYKETAQLTVESF